ncbi:hypothetical protein H6F54_00110 [Coleofasciculus sp. FACHB-501]|nr:hypothetical protein [Coleofasciculus sp. FACHB-501]
MDRDDFGRIRSWFIDIYQEVGAVNPKLIVLSAMALGVIGSAFGVQGSFDGKLHYCLPVESGCEQRSNPDWMQPPTEALNV